MQLKSLVYLASAVAVALGATVADVLADLDTLKSSVTTLDNAITGFPDSGGSLAAALAIHTDAGNTQGTVDHTTTDANTLPTPVDEASGQSIIDSVDQIRPIIEHALTTIVAKKPAFDALPIGGIPALVKQDLSALSTSTTALENALISRAPADLVAEATSIKNEIDAAFAAAIAAYA